MKTALVLLFVVAGIAADSRVNVSEVVGKCPPRDGPNPVYLLDKLNRYVFYQCSNGRPILMECSPGLAFHVSNKVCQLPSTTCRPCGQVGANPVEPFDPVFLRDGCNAAVYYHCFPNKTEVLKCKDGQIYEPFTAICRNSSS